MRATTRREPNLVLPDLPEGVTEIVARGRTTFTLHSRKPWTQVMGELGRRMYPSGPYIGGPEVPSKVAPSPLKRQAKPVPRALPYKDDA